MGRQRVSKGQIIMKKEEKLLNTAKVMSLDFTDIEFMEMFKYMYPKDWNNVEKRYEEHLKVNKGKKSFPMPEPNKYLGMISRKYINNIRSEHEKGFILNIEQRNEIKEKERSKSLLKMKSNKKLGGEK